MGCPKRHRIQWSSFRSIISAQVIGAPFPRLLILSIPILLGSLLQACGGGGGGGGAPAASLKSITIDPVDSSIAVGTKVQLHATGTYTNKKTKDLTESVTWESADTTVAIVSNLAGSKGLAGGSSAGATTVSAKFKGVTGVSSFTVTKASLTSITVQPINPLLAKSTTVQMAATGNFSDGSVEDLTSQASWSSGNSSIATVSNTAATIGLVTGVSAGNTPITATFNGIAGSTTVTVTAATLTSIEITPPDPSIAKGTTERLTATCTFSDGTTEDCTYEASWASSDNGIAQVSGTSPTKGLLTGVGAGNANISGSFGGMQGLATVTVTDATLVSITVLPDPSIAKGTTVPETAIGTFSDETTQDLTQEVSWTSSDEAVAQVDNVFPSQGFVSALSTGQASIRATFNGIEGSTTVTVTAATLTSIEITPPDPSLAKGTTEQLTATGTFSDGTVENLTDQVSWTSGDESIARESNLPDTPGIDTALGVGSTSITVTLNGVSGSTTVTVTAATLTSIEITPPDPSLAKGTTEQLTATGTFSDGTVEDLTDQVSWTSGNEGIAQVSNLPDAPGIVTALGVGSTSITVTLNGVSGSTTVTVTAATLTSIEITPPNPSIAKATTQQLAATGTFSDGTTEDLTAQVSWTSSNKKIAVVGNGKLLDGLVTGISKGKASIHVVLNGIKASTTVTVTDAALTAIVVLPPNRSIAKGTIVRPTAFGVFSDLTTEHLTNLLIWTSGNEAIAQVINLPNTPGVVSGLAIGSTSISATLNGVSGSTKVNVTAAILTSIEITPADPSIAKGTTQQLAATGTFSDGSTEDLTNRVSWTSGDETIAQVSNLPDAPGVVTGLGIGSSSITATLKGVSGSTTVTVTAATLTTITVEPDSPSIAKGTTVALNATCNFTDGTTQNCTDEVSWTSGDNTIAEASDTLATKGVVTGLAVGNTAITATLDGVQGSTTVTVTEATLISITITPANPSVAKGVTEQLTATGNLSDGTTEDLTAEVSWTVSPETLATVDANGLLTAEDIGGGVIHAEFVEEDGTLILGTTKLTVTAAVLSSIAVTPATSSIAIGTTVQLTATGTFSDGSTQDLTTQVNWTSGNTAIAQVSNGSGTQGLVAGLAVGSTSITASLNGVSGSSTVTATSAAVKQLIISIVFPPPQPFPPPPPVFTVPVKGTLKLIATALLSDGTLQDVTDQADWVSSKTTVATIISSGSSNTNGRLDAKKAGTTTITATLKNVLVGGPFQGTAIVIVTP